jgi:hypothetical protein
MTSEVVAQIEAQARELRASGQVPAGFEEELESRFQQAAEASLAAAGSAPAGEGTQTRGAPFSRAELRKQVTILARRRFGPALRRLERQSVLGAAHFGESASVQVYVLLDHLDRVVAGSRFASRALSAVRPRQAAPSTGRMHPAIEGPLLAWVLERMSAATSRDGLVPARVLHVECGDGRIVGMLAARGVDARGADPRRSVRAGGDTRIVAAGALEYLGAAQGEMFDAVLLTSLVDRLRPGAARALAQLSSRCVAPGGLIVLVSARPEAAEAMDPVAADLAPGRPLHPVTWCHLLAQFGFGELEVFEPDPDASESEVFALSARRTVPSLRASLGSRS